MLSAKWQEMSLRKETTMPLFGLLDKTMESKELGLSFHLRCRLRQEDCMCKACLGYRVNVTPAPATYQDPNSTSFRYKNLS